MLAHIKRPHFQITFRQRPAWIYIKNHTKWIPTSVNVANYSTIISCQRLVHDGALKLVVCKNFQRSRKMSSIINLKILTKLDCLR